LYIRGFFWEITKQGSEVVAAMRNEGANDDGIQEIDFGERADYLISDQTASGDPIWVYCEQQAL